MKKIRNLFRFFLINAIVLVFFLYIGQFLFRIFWKFELLNPKSYQMLREYWENGGVFNTFRDCSLGAALLLFPVFWLFSGYKLYKYGLGKFLSMPIIKTYRHFTRPKTLDIEHVTIKNMGTKDKSLDEIIAEKLKEEGINSKAHMAKDLRKQISAKIGETQ